MQIANILLNLFTALIFTIMVYTFIGLMMVSPEQLMAMDLLPNADTIMGLHRFNWLTLFFIGVFLTGVYAYVWGKPTLKWIAAVLFMGCSLGALFAFQASGNGSSINTSFMVRMQLSMVGCYIIGAILLCTQSYLYILNLKAKEQQEALSKS